MIANLKELTMTEKIEDMVEQYIRLRDQKSAITAHAKRLCDRIDGELEALQDTILQRFEETGIESARTAAGTAYKKVTRSTSVAGWDDFLPWVQRTNNWHMLTRAANKTAVLEYLDEKEELPPGINLFAKLELSVNRPTKR